MLLFSDRNNPYEHLHFLGLPSTPWRIPRPSLLEQKQRKKKVEGLWNYWIHSEYH